MDKEIGILDQDMDRSNQKLVSRRVEILIGALILIAYGTIVSSMTDNLTIIITIEVISGVAVIWAAILYIPVLQPSSRRLTYSYVGIKTIEGLGILIAALYLFNSNMTETTIEDTRDLIYLIIGYLFALRFFILNVIFFISKILPRFISVWGLIGSALMFFAFVVNPIIGSEFIPMYISHLPVIVNEIFLAFWLMVRGFQLSSA